MALSLQLGGSLRALGQHALCCGLMHKLVGELSLPTPNPNPKPNPNPSPNPNPTQVCIAIVATAAVLYVS